MPGVDFEALRAGDRRTLAQAITLLESTRDADRRAAEELLHRAMPHTGNSIRIGISGAPGVGKSTFIEALGNRATACGHRIAVLTVDPSSSLGGGSILGDKTRMQTLSANARAFIRPSPSGAMLGGVAPRTFDAMLACEAAGYDYIVVETVGVGQSEISVAAMTDIFLLLVMPAAGDELQGIKRGIMELADIVVVNKADGDLTKAAHAAAAELRHALQLLQPRIANWQVPVVLASAIENDGIDAVREKIAAYRDVLEADGGLDNRRRAQAREWLWRETGEQLLAALKNDAKVAQAVDELLRQVGEGELAASVAAAKLVALFIHAKREAKP